MALIKYRKMPHNDTSFGFEDAWVSACKLRSNMDVAEYKYAVLGLIFLKYISDTFTNVYELLESDPAADPKDRSEYAARGAFWVPKRARWNHLAGNAKKSDIGKVVDKAMTSLERENMSLRGVLQKDYASSGLNNLGKLIDLIDAIGLAENKNKRKDALLYAYEYFLEQFANAEGKKDGNFHTPACIIRLFVDILKPCTGKIFDPCCGSGDMFVQCEKYIKNHNGSMDDISIYGQEYNPNIWRLCKMNLAIHGINSDLVKWNEQGSLACDAHKDLRADFILANLPFNDGYWGKHLLQDDSRWVYGMPPAGNANFAWVQHIICHLSSAGAAVFLMPNNSMSSETGGEDKIRQKIVEQDLVDCIVALPSQLFHNTQAPACLWIIVRDKKNRMFQSHSKQILFIDARSMGTIKNRRRKALAHEDVAKIAGTYNSWRNKKSTYQDVVGFCKSVTLDEIRKHGCILTPGSYAGVKSQLYEKEPSAETVEQLVLQWSDLQAKSQKLDAAIIKNIQSLGFDVHGGKSA